MKVLNAYIITQHCALGRLCMQNKGILRAFDQLCGPSTFSIQWLWPIRMQGMMKQDTLLHGGQVQHVVDIVRTSDQALRLIGQQIKGSSWVTKMKCPADCCDMHDQMNHRAPGGFL